MEALAQSWLSRQCKLINGAAQGVVLIGASDDGRFSNVACWPADSDVSPALLAAAQKTIKQRQGIIETGKNPESGSPVTSVTHPLIIKEQLVGIVAIEIDATSDTHPQEVLQLLKWGSTWLEMLVEQQTTASKQHLATTLDLVALSLEHEHFQEAAAAVATRLAVQMDCDRASIGFLRGKHMTVRALSHSASHDIKTNLLRDIATAMEEAVDQDTTLVFPGKGHIARAHKILAERNGNSVICTLPLVSNAKMIGAITLERHENRPFDSGTVELYEHVAALVGPILDSKRQNDRWILVKLAGSLRRQLRKLFGPRHVALKLGTLSLSALLLFLAIADGQYRATADATLEGSIQRAVVAPIDGFISESGVRAGDIVQEGQLMGSLDDKDLSLEQQQLSSEKARYSREYRSAMADHDRAQVSILSARVAQADAKLKLIDAQLARLQILAPLTGVVVSGDLSQSLDSPVERGDILFEVAPLEAYRLVLQVDERDLAEIRTGQRGHLKLSGIPGEPLKFSVEKITPVAETEEGNNYFRVEAKLHDAPELLRPGMEGIGKIEIGERKQLWIWTHRLVDWMKLWVWSWWP